MKLLFLGCHSHIDPSSGAALSARHLLELLAARGHDCRALAAGVLDYRRETPVEAVLAMLGVPIRRPRAALSRGGDVPVFDLALEGVRATIVPTASSRIERSPDRDESAALLDLAVQVLDRFRPQVVLSYGGRPVSLELMAEARRRGIAVVFFLRNLAYTSRRVFDDANDVLVPSEFARRFYADRLGLVSTALPSPIRFDRVVVADPRPRYLTFVNPVPSKGLTVFARIAVELDRRRPDIPLLVVEGRDGPEALARVGPDLSGLRNLHRMANTSDPRDFYRVSRAVLVPSLCQETFGRVAAEALANGLPVLASDRGSLPETLGDAGFVLPVPDRCSPSGGAVPTAAEVAPWITAIERLWDDPAFEAEHRRRAREAAQRWAPERMALEYERDFMKVIDRT